jgi:hypothetical protein
MEGRFIRKTWRCSLIVVEAILCLAQGRHTICHIKLVLANS